MEYTSKKRKNNLTQFMNNVKTEIKKKDSNYFCVSELFDKNILSSGVEGKVYKSLFKHPHYGQMIIVIKTVDLISIKKSKQISAKELSANPKELYKMFKSDKDYNKHSLTELIAQTLTNQLIFQKVCPHFSINYYWEFNSKTKTICSFNEYANAESFNSWAKKSYSNSIWFNALFQIMYGLISLKRYYNMLHTDFHTNNILVHKVKPGGFWKYTLNDVDYYLPNLGFVFLLHDFGFAWIPTKKLVVKWHYRDTLKYLTKAGKEYYDMAMFINSLYNYNLPEYFEWFIDNNFLPEEIDHVFTKEYYKEQWEYIKDNEKISKNIKKQYKQEYLDYPNVTKNYKGNNISLEEKFYLLFHEKDHHDFTQNEFADKYIYTNKIKGKPIEKYSGDKLLNISKIPKNLQKLIL